MAQLGRRLSRLAAAAVVMSAALVSLVGSAGVRAAAPHPSYAVSCTVAPGSTTASWSHVHVAKVTFQWLVSGIDQDGTVRLKGKQRQASLATPAGASSVAVFFYRGHSMVGNAYAPSCTS